MAEEEWDFYYCRVDDAPASILLNFEYKDDHPADRDTLYYVGLEILEPGDHGLGINPDVDKLNAVEDAITSAAAAAGFTYVGRLRNQGDWQLTFYAAAGKEPELEGLVTAALDDRGYRIGEKEDAEWGYYHEFLMPDAERWQWIMDRRVVAQLAEHGDRLEVPRPVDHFIGFEDAKSRDAFMAAARERGFTAEEGGSDGDTFPVQLIRIDPVELDHIHDVVMELIELADEHGGDYDGWGAPIATPDPN